MQKPVLRVGFLLNPYAGIGGPEGLKGSDLASLQREADSGRITLRAPQRCQTFWRVLAEALRLPSPLHLSTHLEIIAAPGSLGSAWLAECDVPHEPVRLELAKPTTAIDTQRSIRALCHSNIDLLLFVGGDGTARDVCAAVLPQTLALGIPSGVKMHSGVYAINPQCAAEVVAQMVAGELMASEHQEVRDIDEAAFRSGKVRTQHFGEMRVPAAAEYIQAVKQGGIENEALVIVDIAEELRESLPQNALIIWAPGSTTLALLGEYGHSGTLLGVDVLLPSGHLHRDVNARQLDAILVEHASNEPAPNEHSAEEHTCRIAIVATAIGGQGHILGRGNQQITPKALKLCTQKHFFIVASKAKLQSLCGRPLLMDSGDPELDAQWRGWCDVIVGYNHRIAYRLSDGY